MHDGVVSWQLGLGRHKWSKADQHLDLELDLDLELELELELEGAVCEGLLVVRCNC